MIRYYLFTLLIVVLGVTCLSEDAATTSCPTFHPSFPPSELPGVVRGGAGRDSDEVAAWFIENVANKQMAGPPVMTEQEKFLAKLSFTEWIEVRKSGNVTCKQYAETLTKRAIHYKDLNWFMYWDILPDMMDKVLKEAEEMDQRVADEGIESIAPLYCLPVPLKGTMSTIDYPSSAGAAAIHNVYGVKDADAVEQLKEKNGIGFAKTNVPEFAAAWVTCNYKNGCAFNPHEYKLTTGGSSGGSGAAVAAYVAPIAFTEDTGGSTRHPSAQNGVYGYDPSRNHYPNTGNPGLTYLCDQVGINARSIDDIIAFDGAFLDISPLHEEAALATPDISKLRIGVPVWPFVEFQRPASDFPFLFNPAAPATKRVSLNVEKKWKATIAALQKAGATIVNEEWPDKDRDGLNDLAQSMFETGFKPNFDGQSSLLHSFTGQVHEWTRTYLNSSVSVNELTDDMYSVGGGGGYSPPAYLAVSAMTDESHFRYAVSQWVFDSIDAWNSLFDTFDLDFIMVPTLYCDAVTYACVGNSSCTMRYSANASDPIHEAPASVADCAAVSLFGWKFIPIAKLAFPVGKDADGNPVSMQLLARSGPKQEQGSTSRTWIFDDDFAKIHDIAILHKAKTVVDAIANVDPSLARTDPALVSIGKDNLFSSSSSSTSSA